MNCAQLQHLIADQIPQVFECQEVEGRLRLTTTAEYPDGDLVEVYVERSGDELVLTDLAETLAVLASYRLDVQGSSKRFKLFEDILRAQNVHHFNGELRYHVPSPERLHEGLLRFIQAIIQTSDLLFTQRYAGGAAFAEEVEEYLLERQVPFQRKHPVSGRSGQIYSVDFYFEAARPKLMQAVSSGSTSYADALVSRTVRMWYDLSRLDGRHARISLLDDSLDVWKPQQFDILSDLSSVLAWSERDRLAEIVQEAGTD